MTPNLTVLADHNIVHLNDYFNHRVLGADVRLLTMAGRDISCEAVAKHQPDAILVRSTTKVDKDLLNNNSSIKFVGSATIGVDHIDIGYLNQRGIAFANASGCSKHSVAQYVLSAILHQRPAYWHEAITLGIVGLGNIGSTLAGYADDLGWQIRGHDPLLPTSNINNASLKQVFKQSDVISLHVPLTTAKQSAHPTYHLINAAAFDGMSRSTMLINTARGAVVNEMDLLADVTKTNRTVVLDVFEHEPVLSQTLLSQLAIATPHIAGYTLEGKLRGTQMIFTAFVEAFAEHLHPTGPPAPTDLLPVNPYHWPSLLAHPAHLAKFYDIMADDALLNAAVDCKTRQVSGPDFDALRKTYRLRREWLRC